MYVCERLAAQYAWVFSRPYHKSSVWECVCLFCLLALSSKQNRHCLKIANMPLTRYLHFSFFNFGLSDTLSVFILVFLWRMHCTQAEKNHHFHWFEYECSWKQVDYSKTVQWRLQTLGSQWLLQKFFFVCSNKAHLQCFIIHLFIWRIRRIFRSHKQWKSMEKTYVL